MTSIVDSKERFNDERCFFCNERTATASWDIYAVNSDPLFICPICALNCLPMLIIDALMPVMKTKEDFDMFREKIERRFQRAMNAQKCLK